MARLLLGNIEDGTTDEEIKEFLEKYGFPPFDEIERMEGDGSRPAALITFEAVDMAALEALKPRIHQVFWKERELSALVMHERFK